MTKHRNINTPQLVFEKVDQEFLDARVAESIEVIKKAAAEATKPLILQFSGGKDSMAMLGLVREVTKNFVSSYMVTGIDFEESVQFAIDSAKQMEAGLILSRPEDYKGSFFKRLNELRQWPTIRTQWCNRDLKVRPQKKVLDRLFGKGSFHKLVAVRRYESTRRRYLYPAGGFFAKDKSISVDTLVYPLLDWTNRDVLNFLKRRGLPTSGLYKKYGVSGCYWCPFYQPRIYCEILKDNPTLYDEFIKWEDTLGPCVNGRRYLGEIKKEVVGEHKN